METKKSPKADLEKRKPFFLQLGLITVLTLLLIAFEWSTSKVEVNSLGVLGSEIIDIDIIPITRQEVKPLPPPPVVEILQIVEDNIEIEDEIQIEDIEARIDTRIEIIKFDFSNDDEEDISERIFIIVEDMPLFNGKEPGKSFREWIAENMKYPQIAAENGITGRVIVQFIVNGNGEVTEATVLRGVDQSLDREAVRVIMSSPKWTPGKQWGKPVKVRFTFPINFLLFITK